MASLVAYILHTWAEPGDRTWQCKDSWESYRKGWGKITTLGWPLLEWCFIQKKKSCNPGNLCAVQTWVFHSGELREMLAWWLEVNKITRGMLALPLCFGSFGLGMECLLLHGQKYTLQPLNFFQYSLAWHHHQDLLAYMFYLTVSNTVRVQIAPLLFLIVLAPVKDWQCQPPPLAWGNLAVSAIFALGTLLLFKAMRQISRASHLVLLPWAAQYEWLRWDASAHHGLPCID